MIIIHVIIHVIIHISDYDYYNHTTAPHSHYEGGWCLSSHCLATTKATTRGHCSSEGVTDIADIHYSFHELIPSSYSIYCSNRSMQNVLACANHIHILWPTVSGPSSYPRIAFPGVSSLRTSVGASHLT